MTLGYDEWQTPPEFLELVRGFYGQIELDPASNAVAQRTVQALDYYSIQEGRDGLLLPWAYNNVFCNPPYSRDLIVKFVNKAVQESKADGTQIIMLVNSSTDTQWYHTLVEHSAALLLWRGRLKFWKIYDGQAHATWELAENGLGKIGNSPRYLNSVFYFGDRVSRFKQAFGKYGSLLVKG